MILELYIHKQYFNPRLRHLLCKSKHVPHFFSTLRKLQILLIFRVRIEAAIRQNNVFFSCVLCLNSDISDIFFRRSLGWFKSTLARWKGLKKRIQNLYWIIVKVFILKVVKWYRNISKRNHINASKLYDVKPYITPLLSIWSRV